MHDFELFNNMRQVIEEESLFEENALHVIFRIPQTDASNIEGLCILGDMLLKQDAYLLKKYYLGEDIYLQARQLYSTLKVLGEETLAEALVIYMTSKKGFSDKDFLKGFMPEEIFSYEELVITDIKELSLLLKADTLLICRSFKDLPRHPPVTWKGSGYDYVTAVSTLQSGTMTKFEVPIRNIIGMHKTHSQALALFQGGIIGDPYAKVLDNQITIFNPCTFFGENHEK